MIFLFIILPILLIGSVISIVVRALFGSFGFRNRYPRGNWINGTGYGQGYGSNFGRHRRHGYGGSILSILALVALERLFTRRW